MRKIDLVIPWITATFCTFLVLFAPGCRQTTGPATSGVFSPVGPLAPVAPGQTPSLGPFGGPTRVSPPSTGSFSQPNTYLSPTTQPQAQFGGPVPASSFGQSPMPSQSAPSYDSTFGSQPIGSGVQQASWTETNATLPNPPFPNASTGSGLPDPRSGGMQVIDLTGAPSPPGYRPAPFPTYTPGTSPNAGYNGYPGVQNLQPNYAPAPVASPTWQSTAPVPQGYLQPASPAVAPVNSFVPDPGRIASNSLTPLPQPTQSTAIAPRRQSNFPAASDMPSTNPVAPAVQQENLSWRRPGTGF